ncbi:MAG: hypothetical protein LBQ33_05535 [Oscillospiraceae bacterium]|jgi:hypothetical protein|nr:hypothetical protein [Oscillospiraceae bacterium]
MFKSIFAVSLCFFSFIAALLPCNKDKTELPYTLPPLVVYQGALYITDPDGAFSTENPEGLTFVGTITSAVPSNQKPVKELETNFGDTYMNAKVYIHPDGTLHIMLANGRQMRHVKLDTA